MLCSQIVLKMSPKASNNNKTQSYTLSKKLNLSSHQKQNLSSHQNCTENI